MNQAATACKSLGLNTTFKSLTAEALTDFEGVYNEESCLAFLIAGLEEEVEIIEGGGVSPRAPVTK
jgi:hypothetical protein